jgi:hypothetical protein
MDDRVGNGRPPESIDTTATWRAEHNPLRRSARGFGVPQNDIGRLAVLHRHADVEPGLRTAPTQFRQPRNPFSRTPAGWTSIGNSTQQIQRRTL